MKRIAVVTMGVSLDGEKGYSRFRSICQAFCEAGYDTTLITTTFQHWEKRHRDLSSINPNSYPYQLVFFEEPGYQRNIDVKRIWSHAEAAKNLAKTLRENGPYDVVYCEIPPNDVARAVVEYAEENMIPSIIDVNDLWPEAMKMVLDVPVLNKILYSSFIRDADYVYRHCSGVIGTSDEYRERPFQDFPRDIPRDTVYVGNSIDEFDRGCAAHKDLIKKEDGEFFVTYAGTIGTSYDLKTLILAADTLYKSGYVKIRFRILGDGPERKKLEQLAHKLNTPNVSFLGYQPYDIMAAHLVRSDLLINSFVKKAPQSIVTKIGDYLAAGKPMINTSLSPEFCRVVDDNKFGVNIEPEDARILAKTILKFYRHPSVCIDMGLNARRTAEELFDRRKSYYRIVELVDRLLGTEHNSSGLRGWKAEF